MAKKVAFRESFNFLSKNTAHYFPFHMKHGFEQVQRKLKDVDAILEVHDARIPLSGRNLMFSDLIRIRPSITLLNKMDLAEKKLYKSVEERLLAEGVSRVIHTDLKERKRHSVKEIIMPQIIDVLETSPRFHRSGLSDYNLMVIGVPNVGKSTIINALRTAHLARFKGKATRVGAIAGVTRSVLEKIRIRDHPSIFLYDTPGILNSKVESMEQGLKMALCATIQDHIIGPDVIADYMLYTLNKQRKFKYVQYFGLEAPTDSSFDLLTHIAIKEKLIVRRSGENSKALVWRPDMRQAAEYALRSFRQGKLGTINLDKGLLADKKTDTGGVMTSSGQGAQATAPL